MSWKECTRRPIFFFFPLFFAFFFFFSSFLLAGVLLKGGSHPVVWERSPQEVLQLGVVRRKEISQRLGQLGRDLHIKRRNNKNKEQKKEEGKGEKIRRKNKGKQERKKGAKREKNKNKNNNFKNVGNKSRLTSRRVPSFQNGRMPVNAVSATFRSDFPPQKMLAPKRRKKTDMNLKKKKETWNLQPQTGRKPGSDTHDLTLILTGLVTRNLHMKKWRWNPERSPARASHPRFQPKSGAGLEDGSDWIYPIYLRSKPRTWKNEQGLSSLTFWVKNDYGLLAWTSLRAWTRLWTWT